MNPDELQQAWQADSARKRVTIDADVLMKEVRRNERSFAASIFWRDVREVGISLLLVPAWIYLGVRFSLPWSWYLIAPAFLWIAGFMLADRLRYRRSRPEGGEPLRRAVQASLKQVEHQIWLLRNVLWWYILPPGIPMLAFLAQIAWQLRPGGWWAVLVMTPFIAAVGVLFLGVYWLNQTTVRTALGPRRQELQTLLRSLTDETPAE